MLSKEEIEKDIELFESVDLGDDIEFIEARKNISQYIKELEADKYEANNIINEYIEDRQKQSKIIDEMARYMSENMRCDFIKSTNEKCIKIDCKDCFKQYFEKKVEEK